MLDVIIVGGSVAGLSAALVLGRARRRVIVFDTGTPCNRFSHASHGFFTQDGTAPTDLRATGLQQLQPYSTVEAQSVAVSVVESDVDGMRVRTADGITHSARTVLLAYGLSDQLPAVPQIERFWGTSVFHCPYCDGWEVRDQPVAVYGKGDDAFHKAMMVHNWTRDLVICSDGTADLSSEKRDLLARQGIQLLETPITTLEGSATLEAVRFDDGTRLARRAMFIQPVSTHQADFAQQLGCILGERGLVQIDLFGRTSVPHIYAAGDVANPLRSVAGAVAQGASAAAGINLDLIMEDFQ